MRSGETTTLGASSTPGAHDDLQIADNIKEACSTLLTEHDCVGMKTLVRSVRYAPVHRTTAPRGGAGR